MIKRKNQSLEQVLGDGEKLVYKTLAKIQENRPLTLNSQAEDLLNQLGKMPFWCNDDSLHIENLNYHDNACCLTHTVGLPTHGATNAEMPLTPYQVEFFNLVFKAVNAPAKKFKRVYNKQVQQLQQKEPHLFHVNKGRQMGFTELVLRMIQFFSFNRYAGRNVAIMAATNGSLAKKNLRRLARLFIHIPSIIEHWIRGTVLRMINGTVFEAFKASEEALTGDTNYACIFMDESAKWRLVDDQPVFNSVMPIVRTNASDMFLISTPKGTKKTFYKIHKSPGKFIKCVYSLWRTLDNLYTKKQIQEMLTSTTENSDQEYLNKFNAVENSILGAFDEKSTKKGLKSWIMPDEEDEDDDYIEPKDEFPIEEIKWSEA